MAEMFMKKILSNTVNSCKNCTLTRYYTELEKYACTYSCYINMHVYILLLPQLTGSSLILF